MTAQPSLVVASDDSAESAGITYRLIRKILDALFREDYAGLRSRGEFAPSHDDTGRRIWRVPLSDARTLCLSLQADGFLDEHVTAAAPIKIISQGAGHTEPQEKEVTDLETLFTELAPAIDPERPDLEAQAGWQEFRLEALQTEATLHRQAQAARELLARLRAEGMWQPGFQGSLHYEALAILSGHPVHPTGSCRWGMDTDQERAYAPEYLPEFSLQWMTVPRSAVRLSEALEALLEHPPTWWPQASEVDPKASDVSMIAVPVHPLTLQHGGPDSLPGRSVPGVAVSPTLSIRTVNILNDPGSHLKMSLPIATLGRKNRRGIKKGDLQDGAMMQGVLQEILEREPQLAQNVVLADESCWLDSEDESLALLLRRYPASLETELMVPLAALHAPDPTAGTRESRGSTVFDTLAEGAPLEWFERYFRILFDWHLALWLRYGIALESHQQNITLAIPPARASRLRLIYKDNDGARVDWAHLSAALSRDLAPDLFNDHRIFVTDPVELADMFTTITLHLCVATPVIAQSGPDQHMRRELFLLARRELSQALDRWTNVEDPASRQAADLVRERILNAEFLPIKGMVTAGTLLPKARLGCQDINKYYLRTGPNYLHGARLGDGS